MGFLVITYGHIIFIIRTPSIKECPQGARGFLLAAVIGVEYWGRGPGCDSRDCVDGRPNLSEEGRFPFDTCSSVGA